MSVALYRYTDQCEGIPCPMDCDRCGREDEMDYSKTIFDQGVVCLNTNNNHYCVVINGREGSEKDRCSLVLEFFGPQVFMLHTPPNRALVPTGKIVNLKPLAETMRQYVSMI